MLDLSDSYQLKRPKPADNQHRRAAQLAQCQYANEKLGRQQAGCPCRSAMDCPFADEVERIRDENRWPRIGTHKAKGA